MGVVRLLGDIGFADPLAILGGTAGTVVDFALDDGDLVGGDFL